MQSNTTKLGEKKKGQSEITPYPLGHRPRDTQSLGTGAGTDAKDRGTCDRAVVVGGNGVDNPVREELTLEAGRH